MRNATASENAGTGQDKGRDPDPPLRVAPATRGPQLAGLGTCLPQPRRRGLRGKRDAQGGVMKLWGKKSKD